jgi:hypothetical protein
VERDHEPDDERQPGGLTAVWIGWAVAFLIPLLLQVRFSGQRFATDESGSGCSRLTGAGRESFQDAVLSVQLSLAGWVLAGAVLMWLEWSDRVARERVGWAIAGWWLPALAAVAACVVAPSTNQFFALVLGAASTVAALLVAALLLAVAAARPGPGGRRPWPLWWFSLLYLAGAMLLAVSFGGDGQVLVC